MSRLRAQENMEHAWEVEIGVASRAYKGTAACFLYLQLRGLALVLVGRQIRLSHGHKICVRKPFSI